MDIWRFLSGHTDANASRRHFSRFDLAVGKRFTLTSYSSRTKAVLVYRLSSLLPTKIFGQLLKRSWATFKNKLGSFLNKLGYFLF